MSLLPKFSLYNKPKAVGAKKKKRGNYPPKPYRSDRKWSNECLAIPPLAEKKTVTVTRHLLLAGS
jgi:hypothetical protein